MLKQQKATNLVNQPSMLTKKQKKRSSSTSRNKQNMSISHNQSSSIDYFQGQDKGQLLYCNNKKVTMKEKSKKQMISENKQRSISRMSNQTSTLQIIQPTRIKNVDNKQVQCVSKKTKAKNTDSHQFHAKSSFIHDQSSQIEPKFHRKPIRTLLNKPEMSSSSTIMSVSTGNIQFSDRSKEDQKMRVFELPSEKKFDQVQMSSKHVRKLPCSNLSFKSRQKKLNPIKAAIIIQKTWRGYLTRKLLSQYIDSFEPLYQQQLKQIRSSRQSCHEITKFSTKRQQRSTFFDESAGMGNDTLQSQVSQLEEIKKAQQSANKERFLKISNMRDLPLQYSNKVHINSNSNDRSRSTQRSIISYQKSSNSKVSEFTIKNNTQSQQNHKLNPNTTISNQQTMKIINRKFKNFSLIKTVQLSINPSSFNSSSIDSLHYHCECLQKLFLSMKLTCISELKKEIKENNLNLNELMERKDALKDIVENGREFVKNVQEQMTKAFEEMRRITAEGCGQEQPQSSTTNRKSQNGIKSQHRNDQSPPQPQKNNFIPHLLQINSKKLQNHQQFQKIQLPTQQYSISGRSPIQEEYDEQLSAQVSQHMQYHQSDTQSFKQDSNSSQHNYNDNNNPQPLNEQSIDILNQFLVNLIDEYTQQSQQKAISELQYLCQTLKRVSCDSQNKTIIDRCLIQFIVQIMSQTWTLRQIYDGFRALVANNFNQLYDDHYDHSQQMQNGVNDDDWKLFSTIRRWLEELQKWEMNIISEVPSKMESSSFINTAQNISFNQLRDSRNSPFNQSNLDI